MAIIRQYHKDTDTTYVYESISYWDAEKQQSRSKRKLLGKIDPLSGEIIPTGKRGRKKREAAPAEQVPAEQDLAARDERIRELEAQLQDIHDKGIPYSQIQREVNHSYPEISQLTITRGASTSADTSLVRDRTIVVAVSPKVMAEKDRTDLEEWLKIRLQDTTVTVVNRTVKF